ncbi:MAG: 2-succinyl-6-hydroxy-2,4-cyclohexadiene-1-carboxylate synthase [Clostridia bacterium]|nr:2-succinyl-6-hydroxy-2,4-cyclohexadiene-1-carboxylate synthase [Clostridia bacterium]
MKIKIENINYYLEVCGSGKPLVCLHGFSEDQSTWNRLELEGYALYKIDLIGHGQTDRPREKSYYELPVLLAHLQHLLARILPEPYSLLGYSMGGRLALAYALTYPEKVAKIILESSSVGINDPQAKQQRWAKDQTLAEQILSKGLEWFQSYWAELPIFASQKKLPEQVREEIKQRRLQNSSWALANTLLGSGQGIFPSYAKQVHSLTLPILYICGKLDAKYWALGQDLAAQNPRIVLRPVAQAGHNVHLEQPEVYQKIVQNFLDSESG